MISIFILLPVLVLSEDPVDTLISQVFHLGKLGRKEPDTRFQIQCETPNNETGYCVGIKQCPILLKALSNKAKHEFIRQSQEGCRISDGKNPEVCCGTLDHLQDLNKCITPNKDIGTCLPLEQCPKLYKKKDKPKSKKFLLDSICFQDSLNQKFCCGAFSHYLDPSNPFPKKCGVQKLHLGSRIMGGTEAGLGEYPWLARLIHQNRYGYQSYGCGGFLIASKYILTAAHCLQANSIASRGPLVSVVLGEHDIRTEIDCINGTKICAPPVQTVRVDSTLVHPNYNGSERNHYNDIALVRLRKSVQLSDYVHPICLPDKNLYSSSYHISGWGRTEKDHSSPIKLNLELPHYNFQKCQDLFKSNSLTIKESQICAGGQKDKDSCTGDSGGPLMATQNGSVWFAAGIVSYGLGCGSEGYPGVYTNLTKYLPWIKQEIINFAEPKFDKL